MDLLAECNSSNSLEFEICLKTEFDLVNDDMRLVLGKNFSIFITHELSTGIYTFEEVFEFLLI